MKIRHFFPIAVAALGLITASAEEKVEPGPALNPEAQAAEAELTKRGVLIQPLAAGLNWRYVNFRSLEKPDAAALGALGKIGTVVELDLAGVQADDFAAIAGLKELRKLNLSRSSANDATLAHVKGLEKLESLNLFQTTVTDTGIQQLAGMKALKRLYVYETKVTQAAADALSKAAPNLKIETGAAMAALLAPPPPKPEEKKPEPPKPPAPPAPPKPEPPKAEAPKPKPTAALTPATPEETGLDPAKLAAIKPAMSDLIKQKRAAGVVTLILKDGRLVHHEATGLANIESGRLMSPDAIFWIASMTKNITATAVMILVDEGKLTLDEPASKWVPELANIKLATGAAPTRPVTLRDLLSHTAGLPDPARKPTDGNMTLEQYTKELVKEPFEFEPGAKYEYSFGTTVAGRCVEVASGKPFPQFIQERILGPLKMSDTTFAPDAAQRPRIARTYKAKGDTLAPAHNPFLTSEPDVAREAEPSGGLFSTAHDMARFYEMVRLGGQLDGTRILSEKSIAEMTKTHSAGGKPIPYGLAWFTNGAEKKITPAFGAKSFGHGGAYGTHGWVDPEKNMVIVFMVANVLVPKGGELRDKFCELAASAVK